MQCARPFVGINNRPNILAYVAQNTLELGGRFENKNGITVK